MNLTLYVEGGGDSNDLKTACRRGLRNPSVEEIGKADVLQGLERATRHAKSGPYRKGRLSFRILGEITPSAVESVAPSAKRLLDVLRAGGSSHE